MHLRRRRWLLKKRLTVLPWKWNVMRWPATLKLKPMRTLGVTGLPLVLTACGGLTVADLPAPPPSLTAPCQRPIQLPVGPMSQVQVEVAWGSDRAALRACGEQLDGLVAWGAK